MIHTRSITEKLSYDTLVKQGVIPDVYPLIQQSATAIAVKRYPPFIYSNKHTDKFSFFGVFWDYVIRAGLRINLPNVNLGTDPYVNAVQQLPDTDMMNMMQQISKYETSKNMNDIAQSARLITSRLHGNECYSHAEIQAYVPTMVNVIKEIIARWNIYAAQLVGPICFNTEYTNENFFGHPDIVTANTVLDIKTTTSFTKMSKDACLQVLAYYALIKPSNPTMQYIGFVLPMQREVIIYHLGNWNPSQYLRLLSDEANKIQIKDTIAADTVLLDSDADVANILMLQAQLIGPMMFGIGAHIAKGKNIVNTLREFSTNCPGLPCQMFLRNPRTGKMDAKTPTHVTAAAQVIRETGLQYFTHAVYIINLCANQCDATGDYWQQRILNEDLQYTAAMGGKGVVVHTGARKHLPVEEALRIMEYMVRTALPYATETCPLLLETPCGEGTEVCTTIQDLGNFYYRFTEAERRKMGVCIDSCHIYTAGYNRPLEYLQHWEKYCPVPISLVHFNDSEGECGCCTDRHAAPGSGKIGMDKMMEVARWCHERNIPMVRE